MYLVTLNDKEKKLFLNMAYLLASVDGTFSDDERAMIGSYCAEMQCEYNEQEMIPELDRVLDEIALFSERSKKIMIFEAVGLAMADNSYHDTERSFISQAIKRIGLTYDYVEKCESVINEYIEFQGRINDLVLG